MMNVGEGGKFSLDVGDLLGEGVLGLLALALLPLHLAVGGELALLELMQCPWEELLGRVKVQGLAAARGVLELGALEGDVFLEGALQRLSVRGGACASGCARVCPGCRGGGGGGDVWVKRQK